MVTAPSMPSDSQMALLPFCQDFTNINRSEVYSLEANRSKQNEAGRDLPELVQ